MTDSSSPALALIIDHDLGFLMWLGEVFTELGFQAVPALHCRQALTLATQLEQPITTVVVNPELPGAARMVKTLVATNQGVRVVLIRNAAAHANCNSVTDGVPADPIGIDAQSTLERPLPSEPISRPEWVAKLRKMLA